LRFLRSRAGEGCALRGQQLTFDWRGGSGAAATATQAPASAKASRVFRELGQERKGIDEGPHFDLRTFQRAIEASVWLFAATYRIAMALASTFPRIVKRGTVDEDARGKDADRVRELLEQVNEEDTYFDLIEALVVHLLIDGESWIEKGRDGLGDVAELWVLNPQYVSVVADASGRRRVAAIDYMQTGSAVRIAAEELVFCRTYHPGNPYRGFSPVAPLRQEISSDLHALQHNLSMLKKGMRLGGILAPTDGDLDDENWKRLTEEIKAVNQGSGNAGNYLALPMGFQFFPNGVHQKDMDFVALRKFAREAVAAATGCPPMLINDFDSATYANSESQIRGFWDHVGKPNLWKLFGSLNEHLIHRDMTDKVSIVPDIRAIDQRIDSERTRVQNISTALQAGIMTINEARARLGLPSIPNGDHLIFWGTLTPIAPRDLPDLSPSGSGHPEQEPTGAPSPAGGEGSSSSGDDDDDEAESDEDEGGKRLEPLPAAIARRMSLNGHAKTHVNLDVARVAHEKSLGEAERRLAARVKLALSRQQSGVEQKLADGVTEPTELWNADKQGQQMFEDLLPAVLQVIEESGEQTLARLGLGKAARGHYVAKHDAVHLKVGEVRGVFGLSNVRILAYIESHFRRLIAKVVETTRKTIEDAHELIRDALGRGEGVSAITARLDEAGTFGALRAEKIARTQTVGAFNLGQSEAFLAAGTPRKSWLTAGWGDIRESHLAAERATREEPIKSDEAFRLFEPDRGEAQLMFPGDPAAPGWAVINCRCSMVPEAAAERSYYARECERELMAKVTT